MKAMKKNLSEFKQTGYTNRSSIHLISSFFISITIANAYESPIHTFTVNDVQGGFNGSTFGAAGTIQDNSIICGIEGGVICPPGAALPIIDKQGLTLYPVDSEFGFHVVDFLGAAPKIRDGDYKEGFVANITEDGNIIGIKVSNSATDTYKVKPPLGTWCQGLGGTSVKCSTEHYTVMEHALSCHEVIPYHFANPLDGTQGLLTFPADLPLNTLPSTTSLSCSNARLDDFVSVIEGGVLTETRLINPTPGEQIEANDNTTVLDDIATSADYSITLKDDGKPLYRWGGLIKRPNDVRLYARLELPAAWKTPGPDGQLPDIPVTSAKLVVTHWITNNPNDQLRPEDLENEAATGRKPSYRIEGTPGVNEIWKSTKPCYEGDGDFIDTDQGSSEPDFINAGTYLKNGPFSGEGDQWTNLNPLPFSSDLQGGFTNAFYTTIDRDPFEWSYDVNPDPLVQEFVGSTLPNDALGELVSGPRWRLRANKFGQDIPGLEIPAIECSKPPFLSDNIKYQVGLPATTVINLLDWDEAKNGPSPLSTSRGWVDVAANEFVTVGQTVNDIPVTTNGLPMTNDFDLAVYIKGDRKSTAVFTAQLIIDSEPVLPTPEVNLEITKIVVPDKVFVNTDRDISVTVENDRDAAQNVSGIVTLKGSDGSLFTAEFEALEPRKSERFKFNWIAPATAQQVIWEATVSVDGTVIDTKADITVVQVKR